MNISAENATLLYYPNFISDKKSRELFTQLHQQIQWQQDTIAVYGKTVPVPRLQAWYGNNEQHYAYSNIAMVAHPFLPILKTLNAELSEFCQHPFNSTLANLYRDQHDTVGWHSDDEYELGTMPTIASLSLGERRLFKLKHKLTNKVIDLELTTGSLLIMKGETQSHWQHCLPRTKKNKAPRINLTFRQIKSSI